MKNKFRIALLEFILFLFVFNLPISFSSVNSNIPNINARSCIILDRISKKILFGKNEFNKVKMASTTKIMTATIIIENCDLSQTVIVSKKAASTGGSRLGLKANDKITIRDLSKIIGVSKSTIHNDMQNGLKCINKELYDKVQSVFLDHIRTRHYLGGLSTQKKYKKV